MGFIAKLGPSWRLSSAEILASHSLQDGSQSGIIISQPASQPASQPDAYFENVRICLPPLEPP